MPRHMIIKLLKTVMKKTLESSWEDEVLLVREHFK